MIVITNKGDFSKTKMFLESAKSALHINNIYDKCGKDGVEALRAATPKETGDTADSWYYELERNGLYSTSVVWKNSNINEGVNIAVILQYGHGTGTGGYVEGIDYINPALEPIFKQAADELWKEVTKK